MVTWKINRAVAYPKFEAAKVCLVEALERWISRQPHPGFALWYKKEEPVQESRSVQRRKACQMGKPAPTFQQFKIIFYEWNSNIGTEVKDAGLFDSEDAADIWIGKQDFTKTLEQGYFEARPTSGWAVQHKEPELQRASNNQWDTLDRDG